MSLVYNIDTHWNKRLGCFPVRITQGAHNLQWMDSAAMDAVTVEIKTTFISKAQAKAEAASVGATWSPGAYL